MRGKRVGVPNALIRLSFNHYSTPLRITGRFELFLDLLYVAILANFAENLAAHASGDELVKYIVSRWSYSPCFSACLDKN